MAEIHLIDTGCFSLDGGAMFGVVPRVLWEKLYRPDDKNRIRLAVHVLLIVDSGKYILVDTGLGNWLDQKLVDMYAIEKPDFDLGAALAEYHISADDITDVIVTHLHFDHAAGLAKREGSQIVPTLPNAKIWMQQKHWQWALHPSAIDRASFMPTYMDLLKNCDNLNLVDGPIDISPDVSVIDVHGHTPGMQTVLVKTAHSKCRILTKVSNRCPFQSRTLKRLSRSEKNAPQLRVVAAREC